MITVAIPPYAEPVSLVEMKNHLKVDLSMTEDDALILSQITAARDVIETATGANVPRNRVMVATTFEMKMSFFSSWGVTPVPRVPLVSVESVSYIDSAGDSQTLAASVYFVDPGGNRFYLAYGQDWPSTRDALEDKVTVRFVAGTTAPFTAVAATDVLTIFGRTFAVGDRVRVMNSGGALPGGLLPATDYFVIAGGKLSLTAGGTAVDVTSAGSGTHFMGTDLTAFEQGRTAIKMQVTRTYRNRGDSGLSAAEDAGTQRVIDSCVAAIHA